MILTSNSFYSTLSKRHQHLVDVWTKAYADSGNSIPERKQIGLKDIGKFSPVFLLLEMGEDEVIRIKNTGSIYDDFWGRNVVGEGLEAISTEKSFKNLDIFFRTLITKPCAAHACEILISSEGKKTQLENLFLPCVDDKGKVKFLMSLGKHTNLGQTEPLGGTFLTIAKRELLFCNYLDIGFGAPPNVTLKSIDHS